MVLAELLPNLQTLPRADKLRAVQFLVFLLANEEGVNLLELGQSYPIWTPIHAFEAADTMLKMLAEEQVAHVR
jgi:hypothetical protein